MVFSCPGIPVQATAAEWDLSGATAEKAAIIGFSHLFFKTRKAGKFPWRSRPTGRLALPPFGSAGPPGKDPLATVERSGTQHSTPDDHDDDYLAPIILPTKDFR